MYLSELKAGGWPTIWLPTRWDKHLESKLFHFAISIYLNFEMYLSKGLATQCKAKANFHLVGILPSKSIEYGKIPNKKSESWF